MIKFDLELQGQNSFPITYFGKEYGLTMQDIIKNASICSDVLCLNGFEGYELSERLNLKGFYLNKYNCVMAEIYDNKFDRILEFIC